MNSIITYDFHSHILPGIDDGAKDTEVSISIIRKLAENGIKDICLTPHYYTHHESYEDFITKRDNAYKILSDALTDDIRNVRFHLGAEVYITDYLFNQPFDFHVCYDDSPYILTEFPYESDFSGKSYQQLYKLLGKNMIPVIAHIERYPKLLKNAKKRVELLKMGVVFQSNFTSFTESHYKRKLVKLIKTGEISILGSDAHSLKRNPPMDIGPAVEYIAKKCGEDSLLEIEKNSKFILG